MIQLTLKLSLIAFLATLTISCGDSSNKQPNNHSSVFYGSWSNGLTTLNMDTSQIAIQYHGQCIYYYPAKFIDSVSVELIWSEEMDCKFDTKIDQDFGLSHSPEIGQPFAKYLLSDSKISAVYYYPKWIEKYSKEVIDGIYTDEYYRSVN